MAHTIDPATVQVWIDGRPIDPAIRQATVRVTLQGPIDFRPIRIFLSPPRKKISIQPSGGTAHKIFDGATGTLLPGEANFFEAKAALEFALGVAHHAHGY